MTRRLSYEAAVAIATCGLLACGVGTYVPSTAAPGASAPKGSGAAARDPDAKTPVAGTQPPRSTSGSMPGIAPTIPGGPVPDSPVQPPTGGAGTFALAVQGSIDVGLGDAADVPVVVSSPDGSSGTVSLDVSGLSDGWSASIVPKTVSLAGGSAMATLHVVVPTGAQPGDSQLTLVGTGPSGMQSAALPVTVRPELVIHIPPGAIRAAQPFGALPTDIPFVSPGTKVTWINDDSVPHQIHADNVNGLNHELSAMRPHGGRYSVVIRAPGQYQYHCHIHTNMQGGLNIGQ
jgi:hypothetical protein